MKKRRIPTGRYFFSQKQLSEFRHMVDIMNAEIKRNEQEKSDYQGVACGCGCGPFISKQNTDLNPPKPPHPKKNINKSKTK